MKTRDKYLEQVDEKISDTMGSFNALIDKLEKANGGKNVGITNVIKEMRKWAQLTQKAMS